MVATTTLTPIKRNVAAGAVLDGGVKDQINVGDTERIISVVTGGLLAATGLSRRSWPGLGLAALGGSLVYRGLTGHCHIYDLLDVRTNEPHSAVASVRAGKGVKLTKSITVQRPAGELFSLWRNLDGLPRFMRHLIKVRSEGNISHWEAEAPAGMSVGWDAEIVNEEPGRLIAWRSLEGSTVSTAGSVHFQPAPGGRGTEVSVTLKYDPPGGKLASWLAWLFGEEPSLQIADDLRRFKQLAETGEIATIEGQTSCRAAK